MPFLKDYPIIHHQEATVNIKAIFLDLDNTLLRSDKSVHNYTISVLGRCRRKGIKVAFATARSHHTAAAVNDFMAWDGGVYFSGSAVQAEGREIAAARMDAQEASRIAREIAARWPGIQVGVEVDGHFHANYAAPEIITCGKLVASDFSVLPTDADNLVIGTWDWAGPPVPEAAWAAIKAMLPDDWWMHRERNGMGIIASRAATKSAGVVALMSHWGIPLLYAAAFGDDMSDISMLESVGWGGAVENALPEVKAVADFVCGSNDADGVAQWLEENLL